MKIECKIKRKGGSPVQLPIAGQPDRYTTYLFEPDPADPQGPHVAEVVNPDHIGMLLSVKEAYRLAQDNPGVLAEIGADDLLEVEAGEYLTLLVFKSGHAILSALASMGLQLLEQSIVPPSSLAQNDAALPDAKVMDASVDAPAPDAPPAAADDVAGDVVVDVVETPWHDDMSDAELAAKVKELTGRAPKATTERGVMISAIEAAT